MTLLLLFGQNSASDNQNAYLQGKDSTSGSLDAYLLGSQDTADNQSAYLKGKDTAVASLDAYLKGKTVASDNLSAFLAGGINVADSADAYLKGVIETSSNLDAFMLAGIASSLPAIVVAGTPADSNLSAFTKGRDTATDSVDAYLLGGIDTSDSQSVYLKGKTTATGSQDAFLAGGIVVTASLDAYTDGYGVPATPSSLDAFAHGSRFSYKTFKAHLVAKTLSSIPAYLEGIPEVTGDTDAYTKGQGLAHITRPAYMFGGDSANSNIVAYLEGRVLTTYWHNAYLRGSQASTSSIDAYMKAGTLASDAQGAYLKGIPLVEAEIPAYLEGTVTFIRSSIDAYAEGILGFGYWQGAYLKGFITSTSSISAYMMAKVGSTIPAYVDAIEVVRSSQSAYLEGWTYSDQPAYLEGIESGEVTTSIPAYIEAVSGKITDSLNAYILGSVSSSMPVYTDGVDNPAAIHSNQDVYMRGRSSTDSHWDTDDAEYFIFGRVWMAGGLAATPSSQAAYLYGNVASNNNQGAFTRGIVENARSSMCAYIGSIERSSISCFTEGLMTEYRYIILANSDVSLSKYFRVVAEGYDDGALEKSASLSKTIGGGVDISMGDTYTTWNPIIRVRHTEPESGYGTKDDLETLYKLSDPGGTPTNVITFTDNHGQSHSVYMLGAFKKQYIGCRIEGQEAWLFVKLQLVEKV